MDRRTSWKIKTYFKYDLPAGLVVFLVALPLCLGIALASTGRSDLLFSGIISGIIGGIIVGMISNSALGVSGPAAGLVVIVLTAIESLGSFEAFLLACVFAGLIQLAAGFLKAGIVGYYFPSAVIKGMLTAIGIILILKEIPHALGYDPDETAGFHDTGTLSTWSTILEAFKNPNKGAVTITSLSIFVLWLFDKAFVKKFSVFRVIPGALVAVLIGIAINAVFIVWSPEWALTGNNLVNLPILWQVSSISNLLTFPDWSVWNQSAVWGVAVTLAVVASLETLLSVEATDKLDPQKRLTDTNLELKAQGVGNVLSGLIGGLPLTQVIVRSSANIESGGRTKRAAITHGVILLLAVFTIPALLNKIPLPSLAAILLMIGYKLAKPSLFMAMWQLGRTSFSTYLITIVAIVATDLLKGIFIGLTIGIIQILWQNYKNSANLQADGHAADGRPRFKLILPEETTILNKATIAHRLRTLPKNSVLTIDGTRTLFISEDVLEVLSDFKQFNAKSRKIETHLLGVKSHRGFPTL
jgi:MFS superfamily sulfate permease-like transporter